ncbi:hypothetical protein FNF31_06527 [Cafeteria roenbergensis]|uniref:Ionotropic glutamate receptor C-terminal domain-containing protein n=1 Tax=Cafeteria roenbergensis TaxID=33653 RepID=A0A5A8CKK8_CAFRO|nr:hypothetical protein FNF31_06527 [Cafeteria roenbergensis]
MDLDTAFLANIPNRSSPTELLIGTKIATPFSFPASAASVASGQFVANSVGPTKFSGFSWELWDRFLFPLATRYGSNFSTYRIVQFANNDQMLRAVMLGRVDAGHAALTKNIERAEIVDFTTGWFDTGLAIMTRTMSGVSLGQAMSTVNSIGGVIGAAAFLLVAGLLSMALGLFILERSMPGPRPVMRKGFAAGCRDSLLLTTQLLVGASARIPSGTLSRPVATCCTLGASVLKIVVTAIVTVSLQAAASSMAVSSFSDLSGKTMLMPEATTGEIYVNRNGVGITMIPAENIDSALVRFAAGESEAMLYDQPILSAFIGRDAVTNGAKRFALVGEILERQQYGIALTPGLDNLRKSLDKAILAVYGTTEVAELRARWLYTEEANAAAKTTNEVSASSSMMDFITDNVQPQLPGAAASTPNSQAPTADVAFGGMAFGPDGGSKGAGTPLSAGRGGPLFDVVAKAVTETPTARSTRNSKTSEGMPGLAAIGTADDAADCGGGGCHTGALEAHPAFGVTARERLFFKREQWAMRAEGKLAPVLSPNDLLWEVWQRVDMLAQQALLQRAMGRLDVPADLEDVPPELVEEESRLLAGELVTQGMDPQLAKRAAVVAAMAGVHEDEEDDTVRPADPDQGKSSAAFSVVAVRPADS